jgi:inner membrane protein
MDILHDTAVLWFLVGFVFFLLEFAVPGLVLFFFAIGAWVVAILSLFVDLSINLQLVIFLASSVLTILLFRKWLRRVIWTKGHLSEIEDEFVGKTGKAQTFIGPGNDGKVDFKGTTWNARSNDTIQMGENVVITGNESLLLIVKSTKI